MVWGITEKKKEEREGGEKRRRKKRGGKKGKKKREEEKIISHNTLLNFHCSQLLLRTGLESLLEIYLYLHDSSDP
jgi:hypothetical protein